jgi:hypothetical protein
MGTDSGSTVVKVLRYSRGLTAVAQWLRYCATVGDRGSTVVKVLRYSRGLTAVAQWLRYCATVWDRGSTVVKVLRYKLEGCWFDPRWGHWNFSLT